jgi:hypothetical protein
VSFCLRCGHAAEHRIPEGDNRVRLVCPACGHIHYLNPRIIVGCIPEAEDGRILMCRRDIEPRRGKWTFPAEVEIDDLFCVFDVPRVEQVYLLYRARLPRLDFGPTPESSEVQLMHEAEIPWSEIAFPTVYQGLRHFFGDRAQGARGFHHQLIG